MSHHTGEQILRNPTLALAVARCLSEGTSAAKTCRALGVGPKSVRAVSAQLLSNPEQLATWNKNLADGYQTVIERQLTDYATALKEKKINPNNLPLHMAILLDKRAMLVSEPSAPSAAISSSHLSSAIDALKSLRSQVNVQVNVTPPTVTLPPTPKDV